MEISQNVTKNLQWHPAFYAGIQIELEEEADNLIFENEHQLGTKPFGIDVLIIKKESERPVHKNIGRIFRKYNIVEYKSPADYLSVDDFYKVYGYTCFYKADTNITDSIKIGELTISFVCKNYPRKLIRHLETEQNYIICNIEPGIYHVIGDKIPMQIIVTKNLSEEQNLWLRSLTDELKEKEAAKKLLQDYEKHQDNNLYQSVMNVIVRANNEDFKEENSMCEALEELIQHMLDKREKEGRNEGKLEGKQEGIREEQIKINTLNQKLAQAGRMEDILKAAGDRDYQEELIVEFGL